MFGAAPPPQTRDDAVPPAQPVRRREGRRATGRPSTTARPTACSPCNGILFNHECPRRGETFVTRKITRAVGAHQGGPAGQALPRQPRRQARLGLRRRLRRGDVADAPAGRARRLRHRHRRDAHASASSSSAAFAHAGLDWEQHVEIDPRYFRPAEVDVLLGDATQGAASSSAGSRRSASTSWCGSWSTPTSTRSRTSSRARSRATATRAPEPHAAPPSARDRNRRPGRLLPGRAAARARLRGLRHRATRRAGGLREPRRSTGPGAPGARGRARPAGARRARSSSAGRTRSTTWPRCRSCLHRGTSRC